VYGIVLTIVFGLGMAVVLVGVGVLLVRARALVERLPVRIGGSRLSSIVPLATACIVLVAGVVLTAQALARPGL
jgi:ABC-type nickel/cobalt efflux system permease component RcnA